MKLRYTLMMASAVLAVAACAPREGMTANDPVKACIDEDDYRVDDSQCNTASGYGSSYHWFYMNRGAYVPVVGESFSESVGSMKPALGTSYTTAPSSIAVARAGFGSTAHASVSVGE